MTKVEVPDTKLEVQLTASMRDQLAEVASRLDVTIGQLIRRASQKLLDEYAQPDVDENKDAIYSALSLKSADCQVEELGESQSPLQVNVG